MITNITSPDGQYASNLEDIRDKDTPNIMADMKKQEKQISFPVIHQSIQINQHGFFCFMIGNSTGINSTSYPSANPPPNTGWQNERALHMIRQVAIWAVRFHGFLQPTVPVIVDFLSNVL